MKAVERIARQGLETWKHRPVCWRESTRRVQLSLSDNHAAADHVRRIAVEDLVLSQEDNQKGIDQLVRFHVKLPFSEIGERYGAIPITTWTTPWLWISSITCSSTNEFPVDKYQWKFRGKGRAIYFIFLLHSTSLSEFCDSVSCGKTRMVLVLLEGDKKLEDMLDDSSEDSFRYNARTRQTSRRTDRQTDTTLYHIGPVMHTVAWQTLSWNHIWNRINTKI